jgi:hypothetical protein
VARGKGLAAATEGTERDVLVALRAKLAAQLDGTEVATHALGELVRQFRVIDAEIRVIDARAAALAGEDQDDDHEDADEVFDPDQI